MRDNTYHTEAFLINCNSTETFKWYNNNVCRLMVVIKQKMTILLLYWVAWVEFEFCCHRQPINNRILTNNQIKRY